MNRSSVHWLHPSAGPPNCDAVRCRFIRADAPNTWQMASEDPRSPHQCRKKTFYPQLPVRASPPTHPRKWAWCCAALWTKMSEIFLLYSSLKNYFFNTKLTSGLSFLCGKDKPRQTWALSAKVEVWSGASHHLVRHWRGVLSSREMWWIEKLDFSVC